MKNRSAHPEGIRTSPLIVWIRRELRVDDHVAFHAATDGGFPVGTLNIVDPKEKEGELVVRSGEPPLVIPALLRDADGVYLTSRSEPWGVREDKALRRAMERMGKVWRAFKDRVLFERDDILTAAAIRQLGSEGWMHDRARKTTLAIYTAAAHASP